MVRFALVAIVGLALGGACLAQDAETPSPVGSVPIRAGEPLVVFGYRLSLTNISGHINVQVHPPEVPKALEAHKAPTVQRSISVSGHLSPAGESDRDASAMAPTAVLSARITQLVGDGEPLSFEPQARQPHSHNAPQRRQQLAQALGYNPQLLFKPPDSMLPDEIRRMRFRSLGFSAQLPIDRLPGTIDRLSVEVEVVRAANMGIFTLPLETMAEHKELVPGVRFLIREVAETPRGDSTIARVALEYFIDRVRPEGDDTDAFESTPIIAAMAILDAKGQIVQFHSGAQEVETRDAFIASIGDMSVSISPKAPRPLSVGVIVLHGLKRHHATLMHELVPLAGP